MSHLETFKNVTLWKHDQCNVLWRAMCKCKNLIDYKNYIDLFYTKIHNIKKSWTNYGKIKNLCLLNVLGMCINHQSNVQYMFNISLHSWPIHDLFMIQNGHCDYLFLFKTLFYLIGWWNSCVGWQYVTIRVYSTVYSVFSECLWKKLHRRLGRNSNPRPPAY